jgi:hypothetical protein
MKPLSGILAFIGLTVLGMLIAGCFVKKSSTLSKDVLFCIEIGDQTTKKYVNLKDTSANGQKTLHGKLNNAKLHGGQCDITYLGPEPTATPDSDYCKHNVTLKTDRVIKSELASNRGRDTSAANDPNLMNRVSSQDPKDIADIAALLNP